MRVSAILLLLLSISALAQQDSLADLQQRAAKGDAVAQRQLGEAYEQGKSIKQDDWEAAGWYKKAAAQGDAEAQNDLGLLYRQGRGVPYDKTIAAQWYEKAAQQKYPPAMYNLAVAYYNGDGIPVNDDRAYIWFLLAHEAGNAAAADGVQRLEHELTRYRVVAAHYEIANMFGTGSTLPQDFVSAMRWYHRAFDEGWAPAAVDIANLYLKGNGVPQDDAQARQWCETATKAGDPADGLNCLGKYSEEGLAGTPRDTRQALDYYTRAALSDSVPAMFVLGNWYANGTNVPRDDATAFIWLSRCAARIPEARLESERLRQQLSSEPKRIAKAQKEIDKMALKMPRTNTAIPAWEDRLSRAKN